MIISKLNPWDFYTKKTKNEYYLVILTSGSIFKNFKGSILRGSLKEAREKIPNIEYLLGSKMRGIRNEVWHIIDNIYSFPIKHRWHETTDMGLVEKSARELLVVSNKIGAAGYGNKFIIPRLTISNCGIDSLAVENIFEEYFDHRFIIAE